MNSRLHELPNSIKEVEFVQHTTATLSMVLRAKATLSMALSVGWIPLEYPSLLYALKPILILFQLLLHLT